MADHNLNVPVVLGQIRLDVPASSILNETNAIEGYGSAGLAVTQCERVWNRPPNFILVDFYNIGSVNGSTAMSGSIFEVAARANNVTSDQKCCGSLTSNATHDMESSLGLIIGLVMLLTFLH